MIKRPFRKFPSRVRKIRGSIPNDMIEGTADVVAYVEMIEHLENPRTLVRELTRLLRPGESVLITTPNQLGLLSKFGLLVKNQCPAFQERPGLYLAHFMALLPIGLAVD